jgi:hypothetical protein
MYQRRIIEADENFFCEISSKSARADEAQSRRIRYRHMSNLFQGLQAVVLVLSIL